MTVQAALRARAREVRAVLEGLIANGALGPDPDALTVVEQCLIDAAGLADDAAVGILATLIEEQVLVVLQRGGGQDAESVEQALRALREFTTELKLANARTVRHAFEDGRLITLRRIGSHHS